MHVNNNGLNHDELYVAEAYATQGPTLKRIMPRAQGRAFRIQKKNKSYYTSCKGKRISEKEVG